MLADGRWVIDRIIGHRIRNGISEYKVHWYRRPTREDSWEKALAIPPLILWDYKNRQNRRTDHHEDNVELDIFQ
jgi:hypothetical protein